MGTGTGSTSASETLARTVSAEAILGLSDFRCVWHLRFQLVVGLLRPVHSPLLGT